LWSTLNMNMNMNEYEYARLNMSKVMLWWRIDKKIIPGSEKLRRRLWGFISKRGRRPQRSISTTVNSDCSTSHLRNVWRRGLDCRYRDIVTLIDIATPRWRLKSSEDRSLRSCERSTSCIRSLAKPSLVTFLVAEPANWLYCCLTDWSWSIVCFKHIYTHTLHFNGCFSKWTWVSRLPP